MAELILRDIDPSLLRELEEQARRAGNTIEAEAVSLLTQCLHGGHEIAGVRGKNGVIAPDFEDASGSTPEAAPPAQAQADESNERDERAIRKRQAALAAAYPDEYVVLVGDRLVAHTSDEEEAFAHRDAAFDESAPRPIVIPPGALRRIGPPIIRGRAIAGAFVIGRR